MRTSLILLAGGLSATALPQARPPLAGSWTSVSRSDSDGIRPWVDSLRLRLAADGAFSSEMPQGNAHRGRWKLGPDSTLVVYLKVQETWRIVELSDSSLVLRALWHPDSAEVLRFRALRSAIHSVGTSSEPFVPPPPPRAPRPECRIERIDTLPAGSKVTPPFEVAEDVPAILFHDSTRTLRFQFRHGPLVELKWSLSPLRAYWLAMNTVCALNPRTGRSTALLEQPVISAIGRLEVQDSVLTVFTGAGSPLSFRPDPASPTGYSSHGTKPRSGRSRSRKPR